MKKFDTKTHRSVLGSVLLLALFALLLALVFRYDNKYTAGPPYGEDGVFAFSEADLGRPLFLIDGWELNGRTVFIGQYSNFSFLPGGGSPFGEGHYRLTLRYDGAPQTLLLELPPIFTEYTLRVNGVSAAQTGSGGVVGIPVSGDTLLELDTVNRSHYYSGLTYPPALAAPAVMDRLLLTRSLTYAVLCITALTLALFSLSLWLTRSRDSLFFHFGTLCLAFSVHCVHPFVWRFFGYSRLWYAAEDASWLLVLAQAAALAAIAAGVEQQGWYRRFFRPLSLLFCLFCFAAVLWILPRAGGAIGLYGMLIDGYKVAVWICLALCAAFGLARGGGGMAFFVLSACGVLGVSLLAGIGDSNAFEPICGAWQNEYAGFALVMLFGVLMVRRNATLLLESAALRAEALQNRFAAESAAQMRRGIGAVRTLKHELNHHVDTLSALFQAGEQARLGAYLASLRREKDALPPLYYAENFLVNDILAARLGPAEERGISVRCQAHVPESLGMADADLCTLLTNAVDNAIEACERLPKGQKRFIELSLAVKTGLFILSCSNSAPPHLDDGFSTSKAAPASHGLGLPAMRRIAERYDGALDVRQDGGVFTLRAALKLSTSCAKERSS